MSDLVMKALIKFSEEYKQYSTINGQANPSATTHQQMQKLFGNWSDILERLVTKMWQPNTAYELNDVAWTPDMAANMIAVCTKAGTTGAAEPAWPTQSNGTVTDGGAVWTIYTEVGTSNTPLSLKQGGTEANNAVDARSNLGIDTQIGLNPTGTIIAYAANDTIPAGYLPCNGAAVSRATYANLFGVIGTLYGEGDGSTTFNLPDVTDRFLEGSSTAGNAIEAGLPNITGEAGVYLWRAQTASGAFSLNSSTGNADKGTTTTNEFSKGWKFDASQSSTIYGNSSTVQPPSITMKYLIKY